MNKDKKTLYIVSVTFLCTLLLALFVPNSLWQRILLAVLTSAFALVCVFLIRKRSAAEIEKRQVVWLLPVIGVIALAAYYLIGFAFGFSKIAVTVPLLLRYVLPFAVIVPTSELVRRILLAQKTPRVSILAYVSFIVLDLVMLQQDGTLESFGGFMEAAGMILLPSVTANLLYHHVSAKYGFLPVVIYKLLMLSYPYLIPLKPLYPASMHAFLKILLPLAVWLFLRYLYERRRFVVSRRRVWLSVVLTVIVLVLMLLCVMLISCKFRYGLLVVASDSMTGSIDRGDAIVYREYDGEVISEGQVVVFEKKGVVVIHRVIRVESVNGELRYYTQGDANTSPDNGYITEKDIVGLTDVTIKYIGHPTLWMRRLFHK